MPFKTTRLIALTASLCSSATVLSASPTQVLPRVAATQLEYDGKTSQPSVPQTGSQESAPAKIQDTEKERCALPDIRDALATRVARDQKARMALIESMKSQDAAATDASIHKRVMQLDKENKRWLKTQIDTHGWLGKSLVGKDGAHDAWLLVQHADLAPDFQGRCLKLMTQMAAGEVAPTDIAYLTDRTLSAEDKPQRYGTQCVITDGKASVKQVEDPENLNQRRAKLGLPPIEEYLKLVESMYAPKKDK